MKLDRLAFVIPALVMIAGCPGDDTSVTDETGSTSGGDDDGGNTLPGTTVPMMTTAPADDTMTPGTDTGTPTDDTMTPGTDTGEPGTETGEPGTETGEPGTETGEPGTGTETGEPGTDTGDTGETGTTGGMGDCTVITPGQLEDGGGQLFTYVGEMSGAVDDDQFQLEFYTGATGLFDLASATVNDNYATCQQCVRLFEDITGGLDRQYFQSEGMITVSDDSDPLGTVLSVTTSGVTLVEVTVAPGPSFMSTPVVDGACITLADGTYETLMVPGWTCDIDYYDDGSCDCGCGVVDPDCADATAGSCQFCNDVGSCDITGNGCPGIIDPADNATCDATPPAAWMCADAAYGDGTCDCGCGALDAFDCADYTSASCAECNGMGSCDAAGTDCSNISPNNNVQCINPLCDNSSTDGALAGADPTFNRPFDVGAACALSAIGTDVSYDVHTFTAAGGSTDLAVSTCNMADFDSVLFVYQAPDGSADPFDPTDPCANTVAWNDQGAGCANTSLLNVVGLVDGEYQVVVTSYDNGEVGDYTLELTCQ